MTTLSLAMIVRDGGEDLAETLEAAKQLCDELIVVDTGSTDGTIEVAKSFGAKVFSYRWRDDFGEARNEAFRHCTSDWIMWLDCGDTISAESIAGFLQLKSLLHSMDGTNYVWCNMNRGIGADGGVLFRFNTPRFIRRSSKPTWIGAVHEYLDGSEIRAFHWDNGSVDDPAAFSKTPTERNINILKRLLDEGDKTPRTAFYYANELRDHHRYDEAVAAYGQFIAMNHFTWEYYSALDSMASCLYYLGDQDQAMQVYWRAITFDATRAEAWVGIGDLAYNNQKFDKAVPFYKASIGLKPPAHGFVAQTCYTWLPWDRLSICYRNLGMIDEAIDACFEALKTCPERERIFANLLTFYAARG